jgi:hypothetical protein
MTIEVRIRAWGIGSTKVVKCFPNKAGPPVFNPPIVIIKRWEPWAITEVPRIILNKLLLRIRYIPIANRIPTIIDISVSIKIYPHLW